MRGMDRLSSFVLRHRKLVLITWLLVFVAGGVASGQVSNRLSVDFSLPGQPGYETSQKIQQAYGNGGFNPPVLAVVTVPSGQRAADRAADIDRLLSSVVTTVQSTPVAQAAGPKVASSGPTRLRLVDYTSSGQDPKLLTTDGRSTYGLVYVPQAGFGPGVAQSLEAAFAKASAGGDLQVRTSGYELLQAGGGSTGPSLLQETLLGALGALAVLAFVFGSLLALVPLIVAAVAILATFILVLLLTTFTEVSFIVQFLVGLIGLGVAIDYSLLVVTRWREEMAHGRDVDDAMRVAMSKAGHAVLSSGVTVAFSLVALVVLPVPFLRSVGYGGMLIPLVSTLVVLTLLPALLTGRMFGKAFGQRIDVPRLRKETSASPAWTAWTRMVIRFRWVAAGIAIAVLVALAIPLASIQVGTARTAALASSGPAYEGLRTLETGGVGSGVVTPVEVLVKAGAGAGVVAAVKGLPGVVTAFAPTSAGWSSPGTQLVEVLPVAETVDNNSVKVVDRVKAALSGRADVLGVTGQGALVTDYINAVYKSFPYVLSLIVLLTFVLLARTFRSLLLPLKAVLLNLLSVSATFGAAVLFWQHGYGSSQVFGISSTGAITFWLPLMIFAFLFGLSMDYEVFILARMREEYDRTGHTDSSVVEGLGRTGRLVTSAALILFLSFIALASAPNTDIKVFATALGVGILLDATVVRALLVPALVSLFGSWNWYLPGWAAMILRVEASPRVPAARKPLPRPRRRPERDRESVDA